MNDTIVKTCVSCMHFKGEENVYMAQLQPRQQAAECMHPKAASRDPIYGKALCSAERSNNKGCGKQGKLWERADKR